ncbi:MAG TPA: sensor histidine kinase [Elusimicrobiales bacterium]|nr:sensor histidine kinase [Elusimicrobiales bacterium]
MNKRFLATVILCSVLPLLAAAAVIYQIYAGSVRRDIERTLQLEAEYKSREIHNYISLKKQSQQTLSGLGVFSVAVEYQRFEGLTRLFNSMMVNERGYSGVCFLDRRRKLRAANEVSAAGERLENHRELLARYAAAADFKSVRPWQVVDAGHGDTPLVLSLVTGENGEHIGYLLAVLDLNELREIPASFVEKYEKMHGVALQYLAAVTSGESYRPLINSAGFDTTLMSSSDSYTGVLEERGKVSAWGTYGQISSVRTYFEIPSSAILARLREVRLFFLVSIPLFVLAVSLIVVYITKHSFRSIEVLLKKMEDMSKGNYSRIDRPGLAGDKYIDYANRLIDRIILYEESYRKEAQLSALGKLASQVAHDIRSPLAALDAALKNTSNLPEQQRVVVRHAVNRIRDIANNLLEKNRRQPEHAPTNAEQGAAEQPGTYLLSSLIDPVATEKRLQFESTPDIIIDFDLNRESYGLFSRVQPVEFRRMISNLVNNAVEALSGKGTVKISLTNKGEDIFLTISDNGKGIPPEIIEKLGRRGETYGKEGGSGLGLFHAKTSVERWNGELTISSTPGTGTTIRVKLPKASAPAYFVGELKIAPGRPVVVLDDDPGIHQLWHGRLESARAKEHGIEALYFSAPERLRAWYRDNSEKAAKALYLFDYELAGHKVTGVDLAEELGIHAQTILVTSHSEEPRIIEKCSRSNIRIIPKGLSDLVSVSIAPSTPIAQAVLLDDDPLVHMNWKTAANSGGVELRACRTRAELEAVLPGLPKDTPIYLDSDLGEDIKGEDIAKALRESGFTDLTMATGHDAVKFAHLPWLKVTGKEPPWTAV